MSQLELVFVKWLSALNAGVAAAGGVLLAYPGDQVSEGVVLGVLVVNAFLGAMVAVLTKVKYS